jgi:hypothetical protein
VGWCLEEEGEEGLLTELLSLASRLSSIGARSRASEQLSLATKQRFYSFPGSFFLKSGVGVNSDRIKFNLLDFRPSVGGNSLTLGRNKNGGIASRDRGEVGDGDSLSCLLLLGLSVLVQVDSLVPESLESLFLPLLQSGSERAGPVQSNRSDVNRGFFCCSQ